MTMHEALHPGDDIDRQYVSRKKEVGHSPRVNIALILLLQGLHEKEQRSIITLSPRKSLDHTTSDLTRWEIKFQLKQSSGHVVNF